MADFLSFISFHSFPLGLARLAKFEAQNRFIKLSWLTKVKARAKPELSHILKYGEGGLELSTQRLVKAVALKV